MIKVEKEKCKECNYSDICVMLEVPSDEACEAIRSCTKEFLYEKIWHSVNEYINNKKVVGNIYE